MQFDRARVAIHERTWLENLDLALMVIRTHVRGLVPCAVVGILPLALFNYWVAGPRDLYFADVEFGPRNYWTMILVMIEAPLATAPITLYLGQALFLNRPSAGKIAREFAVSLPQLLLLQLVLRSLLIVPVVTWIVPYVLWPYLNEVILLERNPLFKRKAGISTLMRNRWLHRANGGDYLLRGIAAAVLSAAMVFALVVSQDLLLSGLLGIEVGPAQFFIVFQAALWLVVVFFTVARFLNYLDQRIRNEGWEVELFLRAESDRLARSIA